MIAFTVYGTPIPKGSTRAFYVKKLGRAVITAANSKTKPWAQMITATALSERPEQPLEGAIALRLAFYLPRPVSLPKKARMAIKKPDLDKLSRTVKDALTGVIWKDDSQVVQLLATKEYGVPRVEIEVQHVEAIQ